MRRGGGRSGTLTWQEWLHALIRYHVCGKCKIGGEPHSVRPLLQKACSQGKAAWAWGSKLGWVAEENSHGAGLSHLIKQGALSFSCTKGFGSPRGWMDPLICVYSCSILGSSPHRGSQCCSLSECGGQEGPFRASGPFCHWVIGQFRGQEAPSGDGENFLFRELHTSPKHLFPPHTTSSNSESLPRVSVAI